MKAFSEQTALGRQSSALIASASTPNERSLDVQRSRRRLPPPKRNPTIRKSDLTNKFLITRSSGKNLGIVDDALVDPRRLWVAAFDVKEKQPGIVNYYSPDIVGGIYLQNVREVGDVVLINVEQEFRPDGLMNRQGLARLSGLKVVTESGEVLGEILDFVFEPNTGRIGEIVFVAGFALGEMLFDHYALSVRDIVRIVLPQSTVYVRSSCVPVKVKNGPGQFLLTLMNRTGNMNLEEFIGEVPPEIQDEYQRVLEESRRQQAAYYAMYGREGQSAGPPPSSRQQQDVPRNYSPQQQQSRPPAPPQNQSAPNRSQSPPQQIRGNPQGNAPVRQSNQSPDTRIDDWLVAEQRVPMQEGWEMAEPADGGNEYYRGQGGEGLR